MRPKILSFLITTLLFPPTCIYAGTDVFVEVEKEISVDGSQTRTILNIAVENKNNKPVCILGSDLPRAGYQPQHLELIGDIDIVILSDEGMENLTNINIHQIYSNQAFYYSIDLEEAYGEINGNIEINYAVPVYDCSTLSKVNSISALLKVNKKIIRAEKGK